MIHLIPVSRTPHRSLFGRWVASDRIARWWGDPTVRLDQFDATPHENHAIIARDGVPVGYLRWEVADPGALAAIGLHGIPEGSVDMDILIGEPEHADRGAGPTALELAFDDLRRRTTVPLVGLCTSVDNTIAHRAFEKAGCARFARFEDDAFGPCWVYARHLADERGAHPSE